MANKKRKKGAQPGNLNALKHGFYSRQFREIELGDLETVTSEGLKNEIALMRVVTRRVMKLAEGLDSLDEGIKLLGALGLATTRVAGLLKTQKLLFDNVNEFELMITQALIEVTEELGIT